VVAPVDGPGVAGEERAHAAREGVLSRSEQEVGAVRGQGPGIDGEGGRLDQATHPGAEILPIRVVPEDGAALEAAHHHVVEAPRRIEARLPWHGHHTTSQHTFGSNVP
jgi:hypothetical protein